MRAVLPGRPTAKLQAISSALWDDKQIIVRHVLEGPFAYEHIADTGRDTYRVTD